MGAGALGLRAPRRWQTQCGWTSQGGTEVRWESLAQDVPGPIRGEEVKKEKSIFRRERKKR